LPFLRKEVYRRIRELLAKEGIKFAHREITVRLADIQPIAKSGPRNP